MDRRPEVQQYVCMYHTRCASINVNCTEGGACLQATENNGPGCICNPGYRVEDNTWCDVDECSSEPCLNGGVCTDMIDGYECDCVGDFAGTRCDTERPPDTGSSIGGIVGGSVAVVVALLVVGGVIARMRMKGHGSRRASSESDDS